jgi:hypothetical protein
VGATAWLSREAAAAGLRRDSLRRAFDALVPPEKSEPAPKKSCA